MYMILHARVCVSVYAGREIFIPLEIGGEIYLDGGF